MLDIFLNAKVYRLAFPGAPAYDSRVTDSGIRDLFEEVNQVWAWAHIHWKLLPFERWVVDVRETTGLDTVSTRRKLRRVFGRISPILPEILINRIWNVCMLDHFPIRSNGVYLPGTGVVFFSESSRYHRPDGLTLAHELGHMLGLVHVEDADNLMNQESLPDLQQRMHSSPDGVGCILTCEQIAAARAQALVGPYYRDGLPGSNV